MKIKFNVFRYLRSGYDLCMKLAGRTQNVKVLALLSFFESVIIPIPTDPFLLAMGAAKPKKSLHYAMVATLASIAGAILGYGIAFFFGGEIQNFLLSTNFHLEFQKAIDTFQENTFITMFLAAFTFLPFKVFVLSAGIAKVSFLEFLAGSLVGRSLRFYLLGFLLYFFGQDIKDFIEKYFNAISIAVSLVIIAALFLLKS